MKNLNSKVLASLLALAVTAGVAPVAASLLNDAQPQCGGDKKDDKGGDKKDDKGGDKKDDKSSDTKPKPPVHS